MSWLWLLLFAVGTASYHIIKVFLSWSSSIRGTQRLQARVDTPLRWYLLCFWKCIYHSPLEVYRARHQVLFVDCTKAALLPHNTNTGTLMPVDSLPPKPPGSTRFVCLSDTHTLHSWTKPPPGNPEPKCRAKTRLNPNPSCKRECV